MMTTETPFFSIVLPVYNRSGLIRATIDTLLAQTYTSWELIVIDDGSTDDSARVIQSTYGADKRVKYFYQTNSERSAARNNGISKSSGQYICFLDSDDFFEPFHLQVLFNHIHAGSPEPALYFTNCSLLKEGTIIKPDIPAFHPERAIEYILVNSIIPTRVCIHREVLQHFTFHTNIVIVEDSVLWARISTAFPVIHIPEYTVIYHLHDENSVNLKRNAFLPRLRGMRKLFAMPEMKNRISASLKNQIISDCYYGIARHHEVNRRFFPMLLHLMLSIAYEPTMPMMKKKIYAIYQYFK
jgi:GalNAc5-diNAcBac-PP-undecaprenol beta-1,3-glucosyltransferase